MKYNLDFFANHEGRISRRDYWIGTLLSAVIFVPMVLLLSVSFPIDIVATNIIIIYLFWCLFSVNLHIKRLHDRGYNGKWVWFALVPVVGAFWLFIQTGVLKGKNGENLFGADPLAQL